MTERTLGEIVDALGCEHELEADTLVTGAILILHTVTATGLEDVVEIESENLSWVLKRGMLDVALEGRDADVERIRYDGDGDD